MANFKPVEAKTRTSAGENPWLFPYKYNTADRMTLSSFFNVLLRYGYTFLTFGKEGQAH